MEMKNGAMTDKQQRAVVAMQGAGKEGISLTAYARKHGLVVRELYAPGARPSFDTDPIRTRAPTLRGQSSQ